MRLPTPTGIPGSALRISVAASSARWIRFGASGDRDASMERVVSTITNASASVRWLTVLSTRITGWAAAAASRPNAMVHPRIAGAYTHRLGGSSPRTRRVAPIRRSRSSRAAIGTSTARPTTAPSGFRKETPTQYPLSPLPPDEASEPETPSSRNSVPKRELLQELQIRLGGRVRRVERRGVLERCQALLELPAGIRLRDLRILEEKDAEKIRRPRAHQALSIAADDLRQDRLRLGAPLEHDPVGSFQGGRPRELDRVEVGPVSPLPRNASPTRSPDGSPTAGAGSTTPAARRASSSCVEPDMPSTATPSRASTTARPLPLRAGHVGGHVPDRRARWGGAKGLGQELMQGERHREPENRRDEGEGDAPPWLAEPGFPVLSRASRRLARRRRSVGRPLLLRCCRRQRHDACSSSSGLRPKRRAPASGAEGRRSPHRDRRRAGPCPTHPPARVHLCRHESGRDLRPTAEASEPGTDRIPNVSLFGRAGRSVVQPVSPPPHAPAAAGSSG